MSEQGSFNLKQMSEEAYIEPSGILDQLDLSPAVVSFLRKNKRLIQVVVIISVVLVVSISLYRSYRANRLENAANSLSTAMAGEDKTKVKDLENVVAEFSGTPSALWAAIELGHMFMKDEAYAKAATQYSQVRDKVSDSSPMYGLLTFGIAQAYEAVKEYNKSSAAYSTLKEITGYGDEGYLGMARVFEAQGENDKALAVYEEYLGTFLGENSNDRVKTVIQEKITRLRAQK
jgi:predicted negative regulator of RcsB-dependent stress response